MDLNQKIISMKKDLTVTMVIVISAYTQMSLTV